MIGAPTLGIGNVHMVAQHVPYHARLPPRRQRLRRGKSRERVKMLILDQAPAIPMTEHLIHQFPEFPFSHVSQSNPAPPLRMPAYQSTPHPRTRRNRPPGLKPMRTVPLMHTIRRYAYARGIRRRKSLFADRIQIIGDEPQHLRGAYTQ